jgi:hypothetical protein
MNIGARSKILIGIAAAVAAYVVFGPTDPQTVEAARSATSTVGVREAHAKAAPARSAMRSLLLLAHRVTAASASKALFATHSWYVPPPPPPAPPAAPTPESLAPPVPTAPPLPFAYIGTFTPDGAEAVYFLTQGDRVYDVHVGETLDNLYSVDGVSNGQLLLTYKPLNIQQKLSVGGSP